MLKPAWLRVSDLAAYYNHPGVVLKILTPRIYSKRIKSESLEMGLRHQNFLKLPKWFQCAAKFKNSALKSVLQMVDTVVNNYVGLTTVMASYRFSIITGVFTCLLASFKYPNQFWS